MLGVPAVLIGDNSYYEQKAAETLEDFGLAAAFSRPATADAAGRAGEIAAVLLDPSATGARATASRRQPSGCAAVGPRPRRSCSPASAPAPSAALAGGRAADKRAVGSSRPNQRSCRRGCGRSQTELEKLRHLVEESPLEAELRVQEAEARATAAHEALDGVLGSRSWRLLAPLRRLRGLLRRGESWPPPTAAADDRAGSPPRDLRIDSAPLASSPSRPTSAASRGGSGSAAATAVTPPADAALAACLMPAMSDGGTLTLSEPVSPRLLRTQREFQAIQRAWSLSWDDRRAAARGRGGGPDAAPETRARGRVAAFFSGGVDSWSTVLGNPDVTDLIFVRGLDLMPSWPTRAPRRRVEARLREAAAELGLPLHVVETNVRELSDPLVRWEAYFACPLVGVALFFEPLFEPRADRRRHRPRDPGPARRRARWSTSSGAPSGSRSSTTAAASAASSACAGSPTTRSSSGRCGSAGRTPTAPTTAAAAASAC